MHSSVAQLNVCSRPIIIDKEISDLTFLSCVTLQDGRDIAQKRRISASYRVLFVETLRFWGIALDVSS